MLTINAEIKRGEQKLNGAYNVKLRLTLDRKVKRLSTSLFATPKDLTKDLKIKQSSPLKREVDNLVRAYQEKCAKLQIELNHYTIDDVVDYLNGEHEKEQTIDFVRFAREWISTATIKGAPNYTSALNALIRFIGSESLDINQITQEFVEQFLEFLKKERDARIRHLIEQGKRVPSNRAISLYLISIKKLFNEAKKIYNRKYKNLILIPNSPFDDFKMPRQEATRKRAISSDIIYKVWKLPYKEMKKGYKSPILLSQEGTIFTIQRINVILKEIKKKYRLKVKNFSCHSLRKTFGRQVYNMNSENSEPALVKLMELLNHSSIAITKRYLGLRQEEILETYDVLSF